MREIGKILIKEAAAISLIPIDERYYEAIDLIHFRVHNLGGKLVLSGMGKAGQIANNIATTFSSTGTPAVFLHPAEAQHGDLGVLRPNDTLIILSNSGKTRELLELIELSHNLSPHIKVITITGNKNSPIIELSDIVLYTGNPTEVCPLGLTPTTSTTVMTVIGDILITMMMKRIGFTKEDYYKRHHGGYLGELSNGTR